MLPVEPPDAEVQVSGECHPQGVGNLQIRGSFVDLCVVCNGLDDQREKNEQPNKRRKKSPEIKENYAPGEVEHKAC